MATGLIRRGDILLADFSPARDDEANFTRPAVVVTNNAANANNVGISVVPLTTDLGRVYLLQLLLPHQRTGLDADGKAQVEQLRSVTLSRVLRRLGFVPDDLMARLSARVREPSGPELTAPRPNPPEQRRERDVTYCVCCEYCG